MTLIEKALRALLSSLAIATALSCGEPAGRSAASKPATATDLSPPKAGAPAGALPSLVVSGDVATFKAMPADAGAAKGDAAGTLPSTVAAGRSAPFAPAPVP